MINEFIIMIPDVCLESHKQSIHRFGVQIGQKPIPTLMLLGVNWNISGAYIPKGLYILQIARGLI